MLVSEAVDISLNVVRGLEVDFCFDDQEKELLYSAISSVNYNPYLEYDSFTQEVREIINSSKVPSRFINYCISQKSRNQLEKPFLFFKNCPIDKVLPLFDFQNPVKSKYEKKKTFIAEGFLALYGILSEVPPIAYINVNDGDFFQDIYPKDSMLSTQSQKTLAPIYFHKDLANHFVRPDYVNIMNLRSYKENKVYTTFVRNIDLLNSLDARTIEILHKVNFYTPYDDLTVLSGNVQVGEAERHSIIQGDNDFRYFENRTVGLTDEATAAIVKLNQQLHANKASVLMCPGDFVSICNNYSLHGKDVVEISDEAMLRIRWSIKTVNVYDLASYGHYFLPNRYGVVKG